MIRPDASAGRAIIVSPAASVRLEAARAWLAGLSREHEALILAPQRHASDTVLRSDVAASGSRFGVHRFTLNALAARLAEPALARRGAAPATSLSLAAVAARAVHLQLEEGAAGRYAEVGRRPGFPHAVVRTFEELRGAALPVASLRSGAEANPDLAAILERMEREMRDLGLADRAEIFRLARETIERESVPLAGLPLLLLDLPLALQIEVDLIAGLVERSPRVLALVPGGDSAALGRLEELLGIAADHRDAKEAGSLSSLQRHLFEEAAPELRPLDGSVSLASRAGEARECVEIARRLQAEAARGTPFDRMAIFLRAPLVYRSHLEEALRRASIPAWFVRGTTHPDPAGRAFLALLACAADALSARRFAEYLSLAQVPEPGGAAAEAWARPTHELTPVPLATEPEETRLETAEPDPEAPVLEGGLRAPWRWERLLVDAAVIGGRDRWRRRLDGLAAELKLQRAELAEDDARAAGLARAAADLEHLRSCALPIVDALAALPWQASWGEWLEHLRMLAGLALRRPSTVLSVLVELEPLAPIGPVDLTAVQHVLGPALRELTVPAEGRAEGAVFIAPVEAARGLAFDVVFVPGLAEKLFPPRIIEDPLLPDHARQAMGAAALPSQSTRVAAERLGLRLAVGAAQRHVALSWPRVDLEQARPRVPSFYGLESLRAAEGRLPGFDELRRRAESGAGARLGWPAPARPEEAIDDAEYDLAVLAQLKDLDPAAATGAARYLLEANPHLARALRARGRRWLKRWTPADGLVDPDEEALGALARHQMGVRSFSPTALENFASCPYRFLLQAIHRLRPRERSEPLETIDPLTRGALFHEVQFRVLTALRDEGCLPLDPARLEAAEAHLDRAVQKVASEYEERLAPAIPRVWADGVNAVRADLREWLRRSAQGAGGWVPYRFELSFGLSEHGCATADASSVIGPVTVMGSVQLRGSIDLVERRGDGVLRATDHKTGKARAPEGTVIGGGRILQPALYALVAEALLDAPVESGRLYYCTADGDFTERVIELDETTRAHVATALGVISRALEQGFLPAAPVKDACLWCDYRSVCGPNEEHRTGRKPRERMADLQRLRELP